MVTAGILAERMAARIQNTEATSRIVAAHCNAANVHRLTIDRATAAREITKSPAYTQGLIFTDGQLYESTGKKGRSAIYRLDANGGRANELSRLEQTLFGEGLARLGERFYQLTWRAGLAFAYSYDSELLRLNRVSTYRRDGEGWGLTGIGDELVLSDGSHELSFIDPDSFAINREIPVRLAGARIANLNELEFAHGEVLANVYGEDHIVGIDPDDGCVRTVIDAGGLVADIATDLAEVPDPICDAPCNKWDFVLNGIAFDPEKNDLYLTGKNWPLIFVYRDLLD